VILSFFGVPSISSASATPDTMSNAVSIAASIKPVLLKPTPLSSGGHGGADLVLCR